MPCEITLLLKIRCIYPPFKTLYNCFLLPLVSSPYIAINSPNPSRRSVNMNSSAKLSIGGRKQLESNEDLLKNSIIFFLGEYPNSILRSSKLLSKFIKPIQTLENPPMEMVWFYSAVAFHKDNSSILSPPAKLLLARRMLDSLISCPRSWNVVKRIAAIAPVLYFLYHLELNFSTSDPCLREDIRILLEEIVGRISIWYCECLVIGEWSLDSVWAYIVDVIRVWTIDENIESCNADVVASFFPLLNDECNQEATVTLGKMAGAVMYEALFLRLYLKISQGIEKEDFQRVIMALAVQTMKGFRSFYFFDMLFKMLLEPCLPVAALLSSEDSVCLQKVLYDAVLLVDYSFYSGKLVTSAGNHMKKLAVLLVLVADCAIQFARATGDQTGAISYINAFGECQLVADLIKWTCVQARISGRDTIPDVSTPKALMKWLLILENSGTRVFGHAKSPLLAKAVMFVNESPNVTIFVPNNVDAHKDREMGGPSNNASPDSLCLMNKKRKDAQSGVPKSVKQVKRGAVNGIVIID